MQVGSNQLMFLLVVLSSLLCPSLQISPRDTSGESELNRYRALIDLLISCKNGNWSLINKDNRPITLSFTVEHSYTNKSSQLTPLLSSSSTATPLPLPTTTRKQQPLACQLASNLNEAWRHEYSPAGQEPINGSYNCDPSDMTKQGNPWFRFSGSAGVRLADHCIPGRRCGTHITLWSNATMPTDIGVVTTIPLYGSLGSCFGMSFTCSVMRCSDKPNDFIYRWTSNRIICNTGFCGMS